MTGDCMRVLSDHVRPVYALTFSPDGRWLGTGSGDGWMNIYSVKVTCIYRLTSTAETDTSSTLDNDQEMELVDRPRETWCLRDCMAADEHRQSDCPGAGETSSWSG
jgi:WD40 repeat protein